MPAETFRETLSRFPSGLTVVTALSAADGRAHGTTVSAFTSLSLEPPLVLVALTRSSDLMALLAEEGRFGVNVLAAGQEQVGFACGRRGRTSWRTLRGARTTRYLAWRARRHGSPATSTRCFRAVTISSSSAA